MLTRKQISISLAVCFFLCAAIAAATPLHFITNSYDSTNEILPSAETSFLVALCIFNIVVLLLCASGKASSSILAASGSSALIGALSVFLFLLLTLIYYMNDFFPETNDIAFFAVSAIGCVLIMLLGVGSCLFAAALQKRSKQDPQQERREYAAQL